MIAGFRKVKPALLRNDGASVSPLRVRHIPPRLMPSPVFIVHLRHGQHGISGLHAAFRYYAAGVPYLLQLSERRARREACETRMHQAAGRRCVPGSRSRSHSCEREPLSPQNKAPLLPPSYRPFVDPRRIGRPLYEMALIMAVECRHRDKSACAKGFPGETGQVK